MMTVAARVRAPILPRYFFASVVLLAGLVALVGAWSAWRSRRELARQLEERALALTGAAEVASRGAIRGNALVEEMIARRLLDNARLVDELLRARPLDAAALAGIAEANGLRRIDLLDRDGQPWTPPPEPALRATPGPPPGPVMGPMMGTGPGAAPGQAAEHAERHRRMMLYMWGWRWGTPSRPAPEPEPAPPPVRDRRFWEGTVFGVVVGARSFPGLIAVHADAAYVLNFRQEIGVDRQLQELGRQPGVDAIALLGPDLAVLAHSDPRRVGLREEDPFLRRALVEGRGLSRVTAGSGGREVLEVLRPLPLDGGRVGLLRVALSTAPVREAWRRGLRAATLLGLTALVAGGMGMAAIFYVQSRHLREVRALEREVERRERLAALGNLAAVVSHEIRNPLNAIGMGLQRLRGEFRPSQDADAYARILDLMQREVARLDAIVEEVLSLARPRPPRPVTVAPGALLAEVVGLARPEAEARGVTPVLEAPADLPSVRWDPDQMKQVLLNLVRNALEAMPRGGTLTLSAAADGATVRLVVEDTGEGIPAEVLPRLFEPYVTTRPRGLGLGLAIARRIVEAHGGRIEAGNRATGGARVAVTLPLAVPPGGGAEGPPGA